MPFSFTRPTQLFPVSQTVLACGDLSDAQKSELYCAAAAALNKPYNAGPPAYMPPHAYVFLNDALDDAKFAMQEYGK